MSLSFHTLTSMLSFLRGSLSVIRQILYKFSITASQTALHLKLKYTYKVKKYTNSILSDALHTQTHTHTHTERVPDLMQRSCFLL